MERKTKIAEVLNKQPTATEKTLEMDWAGNGHNEIVNLWAEDGAKKISQRTAQKNKKWKGRKVNRQGKQIPKSI